MCTVLGKPPPTNPHNTPKGGAKVAETFWKLVSTTEWAAIGAQDSLAHRAELRTHWDRYRNSKYASHINSTYITPLIENILQNESTTLSEEDHKFRKQIIFIMRSFQ